MFSLSYAKLEFEEQPKLKSVLVFKKRINFYNGLNLQIIQELEAEIKRTEKEEAGIKSLKEAQLDMIIKLSRMNAFSMAQAQTKEIQRAVATFRQLPVFGNKNMKKTLSGPQK